MNRILIIVELEPYVYNKYFGLYSILYYDLRKIRELLGERAILKSIFKENFCKSTPLLPREVKFT